MSSILDRAVSSPGVVFETLNQAAHFIWWSDSNSRLVMGNRQFLKYSGFPGLDQLAGCPYEKVPSEAGTFPDVWIRQDQTTLESPEEVRLISFLKPWGRDDRILLYTSKTAIRDDLGQPVGTANHCFDISACKAMSWVPILYGRDGTRFCQNDKGGFTYVLCKNFVSPDGGIKLTRIQSACLFLLLRGKTAKETALILSRSERTIEDHLDRLRGVFNTRNRRELIDRAMDLGFMTLVPDGELLPVLKLLHAT